MLVATALKRVFIYPPDVRMITTVIPTATVMQHKGKEFVSIPHRLDETRVLNNIGYRVPSPITFYHEWQAPFDAFEAQRITAGMLTLQPRAYVLNELGTGKSAATLWAADYLMKLGHAHKAAIFCTLSTTERVWADEIFRSFPARKAHVVHGTAKRRLKLLAEDADFYIINHDGAAIPSILQALQKRKDIDLIIIDELATFRNARTDIYKAMQKIVAGRKWVWGLTAKPTPNEPTDAWAQCKLITPSTVPTYFKRFREMTMRQVTQYRWEPLPNAAEIVAKAMTPAVRFTRAQCYDMKAPVYETRHADMSHEQEGLYKEMRDELVAQYEAGQIIAVNEANKISKLVQIASGVVYTADGGERQIPCGARLLTLLELIEEATAKVIVFAPFKCTLHMVEAYLKGRGYEVALVYGEVKKSDRDAIFQRFQDRRSALQVLVAQPGAMAHGLTLTAADMIVWYAPVTSNEIYEQANGRITRPDQDAVPTVVHVEGSRAERAIYARLEKKQKLQNVILEIAQNLMQEEAA